LVLAVLVVLITGRAVISAELDVAVISVVLAVLNIAGVFTDSIGQHV
jgi:hypothetical protein